MALIVNGAAVRNVVVNGQIVPSLYINGVKTHDSEFTGFQEFSSSGTFTMPAEATTYGLCFIGAGGSGSTGRVNTTLYGGGYAGNIYSAPISNGLTASIIGTIVVTIGTGGASASGGDRNISVSGNTGTATSLTIKFNNGDPDGTLTTNGGAGGIVGTGNGGSTTNCYGTFTIGPAEVVALAGGNYATYYPGRAGFSSTLYNTASTKGSGGSAGVLSSIAGAQGYCVVVWK